MLDCAGGQPSIRRRDLTMLQHAGIGHPGGDLSATDISGHAVLRGAARWTRPIPRHPQRDRFILSKGHCSGALYTTLAERGFFPIAELDTFAQPLSRLNGHPDRNKPCQASRPIPARWGMACRLPPAAPWLPSWMAPPGAPSCLTGDGELQEGSNWEAAMAAAHFKLDNLTLIVDRNGLQLGDTTERTMALEPLADKMRAFGWAVREVDGHDYGALLDAFAALPFEPGRPNCLIAHTHKGQGVSFMRDQAGWHHRIPTPSRAGGCRCRASGE